MNLDNVSEFISEAKEWLFQTKERASLAARNQRIIDVMHQEHVTTADILRAEFGADGINGLDIQEFPDYETSFHRLSEYTGWASEDEEEKAMRIYGAMASEGKIYIKDSHIDDMTDAPEDWRWLCNAIGHENIHVVQYYNAPPLCGSAQFETNMAGFNYADSNRGMIGRLKDHFCRAATDAKAYRAHELRVSDYFKNEVEIQARMHEIMVNGYSAWGRLPASKVEFYAALKNLGFDMPRHVTRELRASEEGRQALKDFQCSKVLVENVAGIRQDLNFVHEYASNNTTQAFLWDKAYPAIYGQLLEYYGDSLGRERLGLGPCHQPAVEFMKAFEQPDAAAFTAHLRRKAAHVKPELARSLLTRLSNAEIFDEDPTQRQRYGEAIDTLLQQPDIRNDLSADTFIINTSDLHSSPLLMDALMGGNEKMIDRCLENGQTPATIMRLVDDVNGNPSPPDQNILQCFMRSYEFAKEQRDTHQNRSLCRKVFDSIAKGPLQIDHEANVTRMEKGLEHLKTRMSEMALNEAQVQTTTSAHI